jgi:isopentenyldiphosphate isomerase
MLTTSQKEKIEKRLTQHMALSHVEDLYDEIDNNAIYSGVYLFFSFDLVNSTSFKTYYMDKWQKVFRRFYELIEASLQKQYPSILLWKYIGDEVLLYLKVTDLNQLYDSPLVTTEVIKEVTNIIYKEIPETKKQLFIKATLWIANVCYQNSYDTSLVNTNSDNYTNNIIFLSSTGPDWLDKQQNIDFLGPDIDLGFRLGEFTQKSKVLISAELAYILYRKASDIESYTRTNRYKVQDRLRILSFEELKGIWKGRRYPIIWYNEKWDEDSYKNSYDYDEYLHSPLVDKVKNGEIQEISIISKIFDDVDKIEEMEKIINIIQKTKHNPRDSKVTYDVPKDRLAEIHCAAICFDKNGRMLIAKRRADKKRLAGLWEFGCGQLRINQTFKECLIENYLKDFNAKLNFPNSNLIAINTYNFTIKEENRVVPGILFLALIENPEEVTNNNHDAIRWIKEDELSTINENECVENFHWSAKLAFDQFNNIQSTLAC